MAELLDLNEAIAYTRQQLAANDGDHLLELVKPLAISLTTWHGARAGTSALNILNLAGVELIRRADA